MTRIALILAPLALAGTLASAQLPGVGSLTPSVAGIGAGNAAGVLSYCVKNKLMNATSGDAMIGKLTGKPGVKESDGFKLGSAGTIKTDKNSLSLDSLSGKAKSSMCDAVLKQSGSLL